MRYRANHSLMLLAHKDNHHAAVGVPPGKALDVIGPAIDDRFVVVNVDGEEFEVFESDLQQQCEMLQED